MRIERKFRVIAILVWISGIAQAAQPDAVELLRKSYTAESRVCFVGNLRTTLFMGGRSISAEIKVERSGRRMRMEYLTGCWAGGVVIDDGTSVIRLVPSQRTAYISRTPPPPDRLDLLLANYRVMLSDSGEVAGRNCYILSIKPNHPGNPSKKLWIDKAALVALKTERFSSDGRLCMSSEYTRADFSARPPDRSLTVPAGWKKIELASQCTQCAEDIQKAVGFTPIKPSYVPAGYKFDGYSSVTSTCGRMMCAALRYTDGFNTISVFECRCSGCGVRGRGRGWRGGASGGCGSACAKAENPSARLVRTTIGNITFTIVADIAESELNKIAASFQRVPRTTPR